MRIWYDEVSIQRQEIELIIRRMRRRGLDPTKLYDIRTDTVINLIDLYINLGGTLESLDAPDTVAIGGTILEIPQIDIHPTEPETSPPEAPKIEVLTTNN